MKKPFLPFSLFTVTTLPAQKKDYPNQGVNFTAVKFTGNFRLPQFKINYIVAIPASFERCESTFRVKNFEMAVTIFPFNNTDIYKTTDRNSK